jgi:hypothetical protein
MTSNLASNEIAKHGLKLRKEARKVIEEREAKTAGNVIIKKPLYAKFRSYNELF